jgi:hypothetical protein
MVDEMKRCPLWIWIWMDMDKKSLSDERIIGESAVVSRENLAQDVEERRIAADEGLRGVWCAVNARGSQRGL